LLLLVVTNI